MNTNGKSRCAKAVGRFLRGQTGQGLVFTAISLLVLVGFVALVYNIGRLTERRTKIQIAADAAVYSGALVEANSLSTIAWCNSAMAQCYYNGVRCGVNECVSGAGALLRHKTATDPGDVPDADRIAAWTGFTKLASHFKNAREQKLLAIDWMRDLSRVSYTTAILAPKLAEEEMFAVARDMFPEYREDAPDDPAAAAKGTRIAVYPSLRLAPLNGGLWRYLIKQLIDQVTHEDNGWLIAEIDTGEEIRLELKDEDPLLPGKEWYISYTANGINKERYIFYEAVVTEPDVKQQWEVRHEQPPGVAKETIVIVEHNTLGWIVAEDIHTALGRERRARLVTRAVDMDGDGFKEGTELTYQGQTYVFHMSPQGELQIWNSGEEKYVTRVSNRQQVGEGISLTVNTVNRIDLSNGWVSIGNPTVVHMGPATITLKVPPHVHCNFSESGSAPVSVSVTGFKEDTLRVGVGGYTLTVNSGDGLWHKWHHPIEDFWSRHRLTPLDATADPEASHIWQYDYEKLGARMALEPEMNERFVRQHAFGDRFGDPNYNLEQNFEPFAWFDPYSESVGPRGQPGAFKFHNDAQAPTLKSRYFTRVEREDGSWYYRLNPGAVEPQAYYQVAPTFCPLCRGKGCTWKDDAWHECDLCHALCFSQGSDETRVAVSLGDLADALAGDDAESVAFRSNLGVERGDDAGCIAPSLIHRPLVLKDEYFKYGIGAGVWHEKDTPMLFYRKRSKEGAFDIEDVGDEVQPSWGFLAIASARVAFPSDNGRVYRFEDDAGRSDAGLRESWCGSRYNLYASGIEPRLVSVRKQVADDAFEEDIIIGTMLNPSQHDTSTTYLFDALLRSGRGAYGNTVWRHLRKDEEDARVGRLLLDVGKSSYGDTIATPNTRLNIRPRSRVNIRDPEIEEIVRH